MTHFSQRSPVTTIVTPTFRSAATLGDMLASVAAQTRGDWEHVIVDDASDDGTQDLLDAHCRTEARARWIGLDRNEGTAVVRNHAIASARGRYIAFLDADDLWLPEKLERQIAFMDRMRAAFTCTAYETMAEDGTVLSRRSVPPRQTRTDVLKNTRIGCLTAMYDTRALGRVAMPLVRKRQDLGLWLRLLRMTPHVAGLDEVLARYRVGRSSLSSDKIDAARQTWRLYRDVERLDRVRAGYYFAHYAWNRVGRIRPARRARPDP